MRQREKKCNGIALAVLYSVGLGALWVSCQTMSERPQAGVQEEPLAASRTTDDVGEVYIESVSGDDRNSGTSEDSPWKTLARVSSVTFGPGASIYFKRGSILLTSSRAPECGPICSAIPCSPRMDWTV